MKAKELKKLLEGVNDNAEVLVCDVNGSRLQIIGGDKNQYGNLDLTVRQVFPDSYYIDGKEVRLINDKPVIPAFPTNDVGEIMVIDKEVFGDENERAMNFEFHDGYALCCDDETIEIVYPKLADLTDDMIEEIDQYVGGAVTDSGEIRPHDVCLRLGTVKKAQWLVEAVIWLDSNCEVETVCSPHKSKEEAEAKRDELWEGFKSKYHDTMSGVDEGNYFMWDEVNGSRYNHICVKLKIIF